MFENLSGMLELSKAWNVFRKNHPKFEDFVKAVNKEGIKEGSVLSFSMETPEGKKYETNVKVQASDLDLIKKSGMFD